MTSSIEAVFADEAAFRAWYEHALPRVHRYLFHRCGRDRSLAEELIIGAAGGSLWFVSGGDVPTLVRYEVPNMAR